MGPRSVIAISALILGSSVVLAAAPARKAARRPAKPGAKKPAVAPVNFEKDVVGLLNKFCMDCHSAESQTAGIDLSKLTDPKGVAQGKTRQMWEMVAHQLQADRMPPKNLPHPLPADRKRVVAWLTSELNSVDCNIQDPGRVTMRRLNRSEYNNTIRDLVGIDFQPAADFPSDDVGYGFDNIGDVLTMSPLHMEKYMAAAEKIAETAIVVPETSGEIQRFEAETVKGTSGAAHGSGWNLNSTGEVVTEANFPRAGEFTVRIRAFGQQAGDEPAKMAFRVNGKDVKVFDVPATEQRPGTYEVKFAGTPGAHKIAAAFTNDFYDPMAANPRQRDRNLVVDYIELVAPVDPTPKPKPETHKRILFIEPSPSMTREDAGKRILSGFAYRAWRRPVTTQEVDRLVSIAQMAWKDGDSFERGIQIGVEAVLVSPSFLFRVELDPPANKGKTRPLNDHELASRLSYFLWSSMPDKQLFDLAAEKKLNNPKVLEQQALRMLKDPKARALTDNFAAQWLTLRRLSEMSPDPKMFPAFNDELRADMMKETELFFETVVREDRNVMDFIDAKFTFLNERLAKHYGISGVTGDQFRRVDLQNPQRGGILSHASILTLTSNPTRTSPVKRGKWVLEQLLGTPPPPPPPNVPELEDDHKVLTGTLRQRMEQHRTDPMCASCHSRMDPIGFGMENYDAIGAWRTTDGGSPIDASDKLASGEAFKGPDGLRTALRKRSDFFVQNLSEKMLTFALGRGLEYYDKCAVRDMKASVAKNGFRFSALVTEVVKSEPFRKRKGEGDAH